MSRTLAEWAQHLGATAATACALDPHPVTGAVVIGNPNVGADGPLGFGNCDPPAYVAVDLDEQYETDGTARLTPADPAGPRKRCDTGRAGDLTIRLVVCTPTGDAEGRPADRTAVAASALSLAASAEAVHVALVLAAYAAKAEHGRAVVQPATAVAKQGGAAGWTFPVTVPLACADYPAT